MRQALKVAARNDAYASILECTKGVLFVGCLNRADLQDFENRVLACAAIELNVDWGSDVIKGLKSSQKWDTMVDIVESFKSLTKRFPVRSFFEQQKTTYGTKPFAKVFKQKDTHVSRSLWLKFTVANIPVTISICAVKMLRDWTGETLRNFSQLKLTTKDS